MQCRDARELLDSFIGEELLIETNHELLRHLATCQDCSAELDGRRRVRSGLKRAFERSAELELRPEFAGELTARLQASRQTAARGRRNRRWLAIAASLVFAGSVAAYLVRGRPSEVTRLAAGDQQYCAVKFALRE
jgi:hypothetical protein